MTFVPPPLDLIQLRRIPVSCIVGVLPHERTVPQDIELDLALKLDITAAAAADDLAKTVDYKALADACVQVLEEGAFLLLETAAVGLCHVALHFGAKAGVKEVSVCLAKPVALGGRGVPAVTVTRQSGQVRPALGGQETVLFQGGKTQIVFLLASGALQVRRLP